MKKKSGIKGIREVMTNLNKFMQTHAQQGMKGLIECSILIRRDMNKTSPKVPVDTRNLEQSWFAVTAKQSISTPAFSGPDAGIMASYHTSALSEAKALTIKTDNPTMIMGFSANYAAAVHEMGLSRNGNEIQWKKPGSGPKFFEMAMKRNEKAMLQILAKNMEIKK